MKYCDCCAYGGQKGHACICCPPQEIVDDRLVCRRCGRPRR